MARKKDNLLGEMSKSVKKVAKNSKDINEKQPTQLSIDFIRENEGNYFNMNDDNKYEALKLSIERVGILTPLTVKENGTDDKGNKLYLIISGHRRFKAAKELNYETVPVYVKSSESDTEGLSDANLTSREITVDEYITAIEEIEHEIEQSETKPYGKGTEYKRKTDYIGARIGLSHNQVARYQRIKKLVPELRVLLDDKIITLNIASSLAALSVDNQTKVYTELQKGDTEKISETVVKQIRNAVLGIDSDDISEDGSNDSNIIATGDNSEGTLNIETNQGAEDKDKFDFEGLNLENEEHSIDFGQFEGVDDTASSDDDAGNGFDDNENNRVIIDQNTGEIIPTKDLQPEMEKMRQAANVVTNIKRYVDGIQNECNKVDLITNREKNKVIGQLEMCRKFIEDTLNEWKSK